MNFTEYAKNLQKEASGGDARAQGALGAMYRMGLGIRQDYAEAVKWTRKAVERGDVHAQHNLGEMYAEGQGVPQDYTEAVKWLRKAAEQGHARAQRKLGVMYGKGQGVPMTTLNRVIGFVWRVRGWLRGVLEIFQNGIKILSGGRTNSEK